MQLNKSVSVWKNIWLTCSHRVCFQISYLDWWIVTMDTFMRLFSSVHHNVISKGCGCGGIGHTCGTSLRCGQAYEISNFQLDWTTCYIWNTCASFPTVCKQVHLQMCGLTEWLVTLCTFLELLPDMNQQVSLHQSFSLSEWLHLELGTFVHLLPTLC